MLTDNDLRAAFERIADQAPAPTRVLARLRGQTRARRQRRTLLLAGGAAVTATIAGPIVITGLRRATADRFGGPDGPTPPNLPAPPAEPPIQPGNVRVPLAYRPTWLPDGFVERYREGSIHNGGSGYQLREWVWPVTDSDMLNPRGATIRLGYVPASFMDIGDWRIPIAVNGAAGGVSPDDGQYPQVIWKAPVSGMNLYVQAVAVSASREVALRVARSVIATDRIALESPLSFGWLPAGLAADEPRVSLSGGGPHWEARLATYRNRGQTAVATLGTEVTRPADANARITVRGQTAWLQRFDAGGGQVYVDLGGGLRLLVLGGPNLPGGDSYTVDDLVRVTEELHIGAPPDLSWVGTR